MTKRKLFNLTLGLAIVISPLAVIAACSNNSIDKTEQLKQTTLKKTNFLASDFNLNQPIKPSFDLINQQWVLEHKDTVFNNITNLNNISQITDWNPVLKEAEGLVSVNFKLAAGAYIDQNNQVANQPSQLFSFKITNFVNNSQPDRPQPINLEQIANEATFSVANPNQFKPSQVKDKQLQWNEASKHQNITFKVIKLLADDVNGKLGFQVQFIQNNLNDNFKILTIEPNDPRAISGLQTSPVAPSDQSVLEQEVIRLTKVADQIINVSQLTTTEIVNYSKNPASFKEHLTNLQEDRFSYNILAFSVNNQDKLVIKLFISYGSATTTVDLIKQIKISDLDLSNPTWLQTAEKNRLNHLITNSILLKTNFSEEEVSTWKLNPNQVLNNLFNFVSTFGFHYQVQQLNFDNFNVQTGKANLVFKIAAKFWKNSMLPIIVSNQFSFDVTVNKDQSEAIEPPANGNWLIKPSDQVTIDPNDPYDPEQQVLTIDLNNDPQLDFANYENADVAKSDQLMMKILENAQNKFVTISGDLPADYWNKYVTVSFEDEIRNDQDLLIGYVYMFQFEYTDGQNLDDWFNIKVTINNGYNSGKAPAKPSAQDVWNNLKDEFNKLITKQAIDDEKLHLDRSGNGVMGFAQLGYDNPSKPEHFSNFLNFSPTEFRIANQHLVDVKVKDASINYLTNTIKFTWRLEGRNNTNLGLDLSNYHQEFSNQVIKYEPKGRWAEQIRFDNQDPDLQIPNGISLNNILDRFGLSNRFVSENNLKEKFKQFGANWTWKARELVNYVRFSFFQGFNDGASAINMALVGLKPDLDLNQNPQAYQIVLKAKLNQNAQGTYLPYLQQFGSGINASERNWQSGEVIEIRLDVNSIPVVPDVVKNANEILPGLAPGNVLGTGRGADQAYLNSPPRNDIFSIALGSNRLNISVNGRPYVNNLAANHRFIALNMLSRYNYQDQIIPEPKPEEGWVN